MSLKKFYKTLIAAILCAGLISGCSSESPDAPNSSAPESTPQTTSSNGATEGTESSNTSDSENTSSDNSGPETNSPETNSPEEIKITALSGPTSMGMTKLMEDSEGASLPYQFNIVGAVDEISPLIIQGNTDICCVPANLASVLFNKTEGGVKVMAINTLGVIYICENGNTVTNVSDLKGKTIYASGKGATPEYALNYILTQNGIDPEKDVDIQWKSEHTECVAALTVDEGGGVAMLPQPFVTVAQSQNEGISVVLDLTEEWDKLENDSSMITGVVIIRTEFAEQYPQAVENFLERYSQSVEYVNANVSEAAQLVEKFGIIKAAVAEKAIPKCNIVCIQGAEMKEKLSGYLNVLSEQNPQAVGGALPTDDFYYGA